MRKYLTLQEEALSEEHAAEEAYGPVIRQNT